MFKYLPYRVDDLCISAAVDYSPIWSILACYELTVRNDPLFENAVSGLAGVVQFKVVFEAFGRRKFLNIIDLFFLDF